MRCVEALQGGQERLQVRCLVGKPGRWPQLHFGHQPIVAAQPVLARISGHSPGHAKVGQCQLVFWFTFEGLLRTGRGLFGATRMQQVAHVQVQEGRIAPQGRIGVGK
jgi:hypothetical protein